MPYADKEPPASDPTLVQIAPLDRIQVPPNLDGHNGHFRRPRERCRIAADTDLEAIRIWLGQYDANVETFRAYRLAVEQLVNWVLVERRKPLSSLEDVDFIAFEQFLADPNPELRWINSRRTVRSDINWRPFRGPLSVKARLHSLRILRVMFDWLRNTGYCDVGSSLWRHAIRSFPEPSALILTAFRDTSPKVIQFDDWHLLRRSLDQANNEENLRARLAIELMYYGSLNVKEVAEARQGDLVTRDGALMLEIPSRPAHLSQIYLVPPLIETICRARGSARDKLRGSQVTGRGERLVEKGDIGRLAKGAINRASRFALSEGKPTASKRLHALTPHCLRHAFEVHAMLIGESSKWLWVLIGAAWLVPATTRRSLPRRKLEERIDDLQDAFCSLAPCWGEEGLTCFGGP